MKKIPLRIMTGKKWLTCLWGTAGALTLGGVMVFIQQNAQDRSLRIILPVFLLMVVSDFWMAWVNHKNIRSGTANLYHDLTGKTAVVVKPFEVVNGRYVGRVSLRGTTWQACSANKAFAKDENVIVQRREGLKLFVKEKGCVPAMDPCA